MSFFQSSWEVKENKKKSIHMSRAKMLDVGDVYDLSKHFKLQAKFTCIYIALYSVSVSRKNKK